MISQHSVNPAIIVCFPYSMIKTVKAHVLEDNIRILRFCILILHFMQGQCVGLVITVYPMSKQRWKGSSSPRNLMWKLRTWAGDRGEGLKTAAFLFTALSKAPSPLFFFHSQTFSLVPSLSSLLVFLLCRFTYILFFSKVWWQAATLFYYFTLNEHTYNI